MAELSPQAQAVLDALCMEELSGPQQLMARAHAAAALRAAADQLPLQPLTWDPADPFEQGLRQGQELSRAELLGIAAELESISRWGNSAKPEPQGALEEHYEWELEDASGEWVAGGSANDQEAVHQEGMRYLSAYSQDGPHKLTIRRHQVHTVLQASASVTDELPLD